MPKISELTTQASPTTAAVVPIVQAGTTEKATLATLPISTPTQTALDLKAPLASPTFTGTVTIPSGASISGFAPLASPTFTGTTTIPTVAIAAGTITGITDLAIADGGTGASTAAAAFTALKQAASETDTGVVELATTAEYTTGTDTTRVLTPATARARNLVIGTLTTTTSGTSIDFTSIPSWVKRITFTMNGVSTNGTSEPLVQIGDSGGIETTGYLGGQSYLTNGATVTGSNPSTGFGTTASWAATFVLHGIGTLCLMDASTNLWCWSFNGALSDHGATMASGGTKSLSATLDRIRLTTVGGANTFDAGSVNILYE